MPAKKDSPKTSALSGPVSQNYPPMPGHESLSAKDRWTLLMAIQGAKAREENTLVDVLKNPTPLPVEFVNQWDNDSAVPAKSDFRQWLEEWLNSGKIMPPGAEKLARYAQDQEIMLNFPLTGEQIAAFQKENTPESDFLKNKLSFFLDGEPSVFSWVASGVKAFETTQKNYTAEWLERQSEKSSSVETVDPSLLDEESRASLARHLENLEEMRVSEIRKKSNPRWDFGALAAIAGAVKSEWGKAILVTWSVAGKAAKIQKTRQELGAFAMSMPDMGEGGDELRKLNGWTNWRLSPKFTPGDKIFSPGRRAAFSMGLSSESCWMDKELSDWLIQEDRALKALRPVALAELLRLAAENPTRMKAFVEQVHLRMKSPLSQDMGGAEDASAEPALDQAFPGWEFDWEKRGVVGAVSPAQKSASSQSQVWKEALHEGALGKLAVNVAKIYGLEATDGASLIGEAKKALMEEAGWTQGVWRLAANSPEFAELSADYLSAQARAGQTKLRRHDQGVKNRERRRERLFGVSPVSSDEQKAALLLQRQESGVAMDRWFVEKRAELDASSSARALMAIGCTAVERGGLDEDFLAFAKFISKVPSTSSNLDARLSEQPRWAARLLAGAGSCLTHSSEAAVLQALRDQEACQELTSQWAAAFAEGLGRAKKLVQKEAKRKLGSVAEGEDSPAAKKQENALAERKFRNSLELLMDCVSATPGFMQTLPKKFNWGFLMNAQERWHAQEQEREFSNSRDAHLAWEPVAAEFSEGDFSAVPLKNARDLFDEGKAMTHCVFNYTDRCHEGTTRIISIRQGERRVSTLELFPANAKGERLVLDPTGRNAHEVFKWLRGQNNGPHNGAIRDPGVLEFCDIYQEHLGEMAKIAREERAAVRSLSDKAPSPKRASKKGAIEKKSASSGAVRKSRS